MYVSVWICSECICCSDAKYNQNLIRIHESGCFFFIVSCHTAPLIYQPASQNILIINHVLRHLDDERRMKPSATLSTVGEFVIRYVCVVFDSNSLKCSTNTTQSGKHLRFVCTSNARLCIFLHFTSLLLPQNKVNYKDDFKFISQFKCKVASFDDE